MAPGRAAMAQNSLGPGLRTVSGPGIVARGGELWRGLAVQNRFQQARPESIFAGVISNLHLPAPDVNLKIPIKARAARKIARERPHTSKFEVPPSFRREEFRRERATEPEPAPLLLERFLMVTPVAAAPKE